MRKHTPIPRCERPAGRLLHRGLPLLLVACLLGGLLAGCEINEPAMPTFDTSLTIPLGVERVDLLEAVEDEDYIVIGDDGSLSFTVDGDPDTMSFDFELTADIGSQTIEQGLGEFEIAASAPVDYQFQLGDIWAPASGVSGMPAVVPSFPIDVLSAPQDVPDIDSAVLTQGQVVITVDNQLPVPVSADSGPGQLVVTLENPADGAAFAIVMAVTEPEGPPHARASMILVPTDTPGFNHVRRISIMGDEGSGWASHSEIKYEGCRVPKENIIGGRGQGFLIAQKRLGPGRIHHCMRWIGIAERALDLMCKRAVSREVAPGKPLGTRQMVQAFIAESRAEIDAARLYVEHVADTIDQKGTHAARTEISCIKFFVANILQTVLDRSIQVHGALGITDDLPLSHLFRHERGARIYDGPDEVHKASVARRILRGYGLELGSIGK